MKNLLHTYKITLWVPQGSVEAPHVLSIHKTMLRREKTLKNSTVLSTERQRTVNKVDIPEKCKIHKWFARKQSDFYTCGIQSWIEKGTNWKL